MCPKPSSLMSLRSVTYYIFFCTEKVGWIWHETFLSSSIDDTQVRKLHTSPEILSQSSSNLVNDASLMSFIQKATVFFCAGKVGRIWHETFLSSLIDAMQVRKLHTSPEIFPQSSFKLVNDASLMSFSQQATVFFLRREERSNLTWNISILINWWYASEKVAY